MALPLHSATQILQPKQRVLLQLPKVAVYSCSRAISLTEVSATSAQHSYFLLNKIKC